MRNDDGITPEEGEVVIPVSVRLFHYDNDWAVLQRTDTGAFPQTIPVATSEQDIPRYGVQETN